MSVLVVLVLPVRREPVSHGAHCAAAPTTPSPVNPALVGTAAPVGEAADEGNRQGHGITSKCELSCGSDV